jgi:hypothetical protein
MQKSSLEHISEHALSRERDRDEHIDADVGDAERYADCEPLAADEEDESDGE